MLNPCSQESQAPRTGNFHSRKLISEATTKLPSTTRVNRDQRMRNIYGALSKRLREVDGRMLSQALGLEPIKVSTNHMDLGEIVCFFA